MMIGMRWVQRQAWQVGVSNSSWVLVLLVGMTNAAKELLHQQLQNKKGVITGFVVCLFVLDF